MTKVVITSLSIALAGLTLFLFAPPKVIQPLEGFLGANIPDRCENFTQLASRSTKGVIKAASGKVYSYRVTSQATGLKYFQLFDRATNPGITTVPVYSIPIAATTASSSPSLITQVFDPPLDFTAGITFGMSANLATYASATNNPLNYLVSVCYY